MTALLIKKIIIIILYSIQLTLFYLCNDNGLIYDTIYELIISLGPIFIKFGQWMANRTDLLPDELCTLLKSLQDNCTCHEWKHTQKIIDELPIEISDHLYIRQKIIGSGCIAQVYKGIYHNKSVAIKVIHPNIIQETHDSIKILKLIIKYCTLVPDIKKVNKSFRFDSFYQLIQDQSNLINEANNIIQFTKIYNKTTTKTSTPNNNCPFIIPTLYYYNSNIIIESFEDGLSLQEIKLNYPDKMDESIGKLWKLYHLMINNNLIHGDFHPGNIKIRINSKTNIITPVLLDYGIVSKLDNKRHQLLKESFEYICFPDMEKVVELLLLSNIAKMTSKQKLQFKEHNVQYFKKMGIQGMHQNVKKYGILHGCSKQNLDMYKRDPKLISEFLNIADKSGIVLDLDFMNILLGISLLENYNNVYSPDNLTNIIKYIFI